MVIVLFIAMLLLGLTVATFRHSAALNLEPAVRVLGDPLPRIQCPPGYTATLYAQGLSSPDGLAFSPDGVLYVAEETAGRVSQVDATGVITPVLTDLDSPEGIAFDDSGNLYVVEDREDGRLVKRTPLGVTSTLATDLEAPEGVVWTSGDTLYVTESNIQFVTNPLLLRTRVARVSGGNVTRILTNTPSVNGSTVIFWSYAGLTAAPDGDLYLTNELSNQPITQTFGPFTFTLFTTDSIFSLNPLTAVRTRFASDLVTPEGLRYSASGNFPLYVTEEDTGGGGGRLSRVQPDGSHTTLCTGFLTIEDVVVDPQGRLYVSEDTSGSIIQIVPPRQLFLPIMLRSS